MTENQKRSARRKLARRHEMITHAAEALRREGLALTGDVSTIILASAEWLGSNEGRAAVLALHAAAGTDDDTDVDEPPSRKRAS